MSYGGYADGVLMVFTSSNISFYLSFKNLCMVGPSRQLQTWGITRVKDDS
jgi:hypothetical protein